MVVTKALGPLRGAARGAADRGGRARTGRASARATCRRARAATVRAPASTGTRRRRTGRARRRPWSAGSALPHTTLSRRAAPLLARRARSADVRNDLLQRRASSAVSSLGRPSRSARHETLNSRTSLRSPQFALPVPLRTPARRMFEETLLRFAVLRG